MGLAAGVRLGLDDAGLDLLGRYYDREGLVHAGRQLIWLSTVGGAALTVAIVVALFIRHESRRALFFAIAIGGSILLTEAFKELLQRPGLGDADGYSFPSGNAAVAAAAVGGVLILVPQSRTRILLALAGLALALLNGVALVFLYWHYPSDVLGGWCLGVAWVAFAAVLVEPRRAVQPGISASAGPTVVVRESGRM